MQFNVISPSGISLGTIDVTEEVYMDDDALVGVLVDAGYVEDSEILEVTEESDNSIDIFDYDSGTLRISLILIH